MTWRRPDAASEERLRQLRREAEEKGRVAGAGVRPAGAPFPDLAPPDASYYGLPLLKPPVWTWEVPTYFFVGGVAGGAAVIALMAQLTGDEGKLLRDARYVAAIGANVSGALLVTDLGRPERFLNMMRVFKPQSPMSVGAWTLASFGASSTLAALAEALRSRGRGPRMVGNGAGALAGATGLVMITYTGVLIGVTSIPVWSKHVRTLPAHFAASGLGAAVSVLQLLGHDGNRALQTLGIAAAAFEVLTGMRIEMSPDPESEPLRHGTTGITTRLGGFFSGPLPLLLRLAGLRSRRARSAAAVSTLLGSLITRFAWIEAGKKSVEG
jgi:hypothetical protein